MGKVKVLEQTGEGGASQCQQGIKGLQGLQVWGDTNNLRSPHRVCRRRAELHALLTLEQRTTAAGRGSSGSGGFGGTGTGTGTGSAHSKDAEKEAERKRNSKYQATTELQPNHLSGIRNSYLVEK